MTSVQALREFINERLTAAAGEIFTVFEQTIVQFQEEINRQRRLLETNCRPQLNFHRTELPQQHDGREEWLFEQETNSCLKGGEPEPPQIKEKEEEEEPGFLHIKEEQEELQPPQIEEHGTSQKGEQFILKCESDAFQVPATEEQSYLSEPEEGPDTEQFLSLDSEGHYVKIHIDSESTKNTEMKTISMFHSDSVENFPVLEKQAECEKDLCEETCGKTALKKHKLCQKVEMVTDEKIICEPCGKSFNRQSRLLVHTRTHTGEKPYSCETCAKSFFHQSGLLRHMRSHTGEKPYSCKTCGKSFSQRSALLCHMRIHSGEKPYTCEICRKSFIRRSHLLVHMRTHTGEKPYSCETCGKRFSKRSHLLGHMGTHMVEKPHCCQTCGLGFSHRSSFLRHLKTHTQVKS